MAVLMAGNVKVDNIAINLPQAMKLIFCLYGISRRQKHRTPLIFKVLSGTCFEWCLLINQGCSKVPRMKKSRRKKCSALWPAIYRLSRNKNSSGKFGTPVGADMTRFDPFSLYVHLRVYSKIPFGTIDSRYKVNIKCYENSSVCHINDSLFSCIHCFWTVL